MRRIPIRKKTMENKLTTLLDPIITTVKIVSNVNSMIMIANYKAIAHDHFDSIDLVLQAYVTIT